MGGFVLKKDRSLHLIWAMFLVFCILFCINIAVSGEHATNIAWMLLELWVLIIDIIILIRYGFPSVRAMVISLALGLTAALTYVDALVLTGRYDAGIVSLLVTFNLTLLSGIAAATVFRSRPDLRLRVVYGYRCRDVILSIIIGLLTGIVYGTINCLLMLGSGKPNLHITVHCFLMSLSPAIFEELAMRTVFYVFCIALFREGTMSRFKKFTCWFMMIMPHVMIHTPTAFQQNGIISGMISIVIYVVIFGSTFAILQKKRDIFSAMLAHGTVDLIRFCLYGLPL